MSTTQAKTRMTAEEFLALPDQGTDRQLLRGRLMEKPMTYRNRTHAWVEARVALLLGNWLATQNPPAGELFSGEVGCVLRRDPDTIVGIDVAYFDCQTVEGSGSATTLIEGPPVLAVEILSPSDRQEDIHAKVREYLEAGTRQAWVVDPYFRTVTVHGSGRPPEMYNEQQSLRGGDLLPGLELPVKEMFPADKQAAGEK
ncbi:MAG: Uma2 family endonuclease [Pirellulaceae bacterium]|nr:Uma2 family endonuclease [Pirellulaceae bacterium]